MNKSKFDKESEIFIHSSSPSSQIYDSIWLEQHGLNSQSVQDKKRTLQDEESGRRSLSSLIIPSHFYERNQVLNFSKDLKVLDVCAGHGSLSLAAVDSGSENVYMCDGSKNTLIHMSKLIRENENFRKYLGKITPIQVNVESINEAFETHSFDVVFQRFAIHHLRNPFLVAYHLSTLVKPGGILSFNYFTTGCTPEISRELRKFLLQKDPDYIRDLFISMGSFSRLDKVPNLRELIFGKNLEDTRIFDSILFFRSIIEKYGYDSFSKRIHYEDANTPYLHNIDRKKMERFVSADLGLSIVDKRDTADEQSLTIQIPEKGVNKISVEEIPHPSIFSTEDISIGDGLISRISCLA